MEIRRAIFDVPSSAGSYDFNISGWSETPKAVRIVMFHNRSTDDGSEAVAGMSVGFTDGTNEGCEGYVAYDAAGTTDTWRESTNGSLTSDPYYQDIICNFNQWNTGGVKLDFSGDGLSYAENRIEITFFAGSDVSAGVLWASPGDHVTSLSFTSKLILSATSGLGVPDQTNDATIGIGVCTNGSNGLTQQFVELFNADGAGTTDLEAGLYTGYVAGQNYYDTWEWQTTISSVDSNGFNLSDSDTDTVLFLCLTFDEDVDSGTATVPTSGDISVTDPGFTPQFLDLIFPVNITTLNSWDLSKSYQGIGIGGFDGETEESVSVVGRDNVGTSEEDTVHSSNVLHSENNSGTDIFDASVDSSGVFTANGFDLTVNTHPGTAAYFIWWVLESAGGTTYNDSVAESGTIDDTPSAVKVMSASVAESCSIDDTPSAVQTTTSAGSESATIDDTPSVQMEANGAGSESAIVDDVPSVQMDANSSGAESATIDDVPSAVRTIADSNSESATIDDQPSAAQTQADTIPESGDVDDQPSAVKIIAATIAETATIDETILAAEANTDSVSESATIDDTPSAIKELQGSGAESATADDTPSVQMEANSAGSESLDIDETPSAVKILAGEVLETATIDDTPDATVPAVEGTVGEGASISDSPSAQLVSYPDITESLAIVASQSANQNLHVSVSESASIDETSSTEAAETGVVSGTLSGVEVTGVLVEVEPEGELACSPVSGGLSETDITGVIAETDVTGELKDGKN